MASKFQEAIFWAYQIMDKLCDCQMFATQKSSIYCLLAYIPKRFNFRAKICCQNLCLVQPILKWRKIIATVRRKIGKVITFKCS